MTEWAETPTALVTGAAVRIGRDIALALADRGYRIVIHCRESVGEAEALRKSLLQSGGTAFVVRGDLAHAGQRDQMMRDALAATGTLDVLVNCASVFSRESLAGSSDVSVAREFEVNLFAPISLTRAFAAAHAARGAHARMGHVVNILDRRVSGLDTDFLPYVLSKKSLQDFTKMAAVELAPGIAVNAIAPGAILPPVIQGDASASEPRGDALLAHACTPQDVADAVCFLVTSRGITGQTLFVDSGQNLIL